jgi:hypothetical protein
MKYMLLIHQGTTPLPGTEQWEALSEQEQRAVYASYQSINEERSTGSGAIARSPRRHVCSSSAPPRRRRSRRCGFR